MKHHIINNMQTTLRKNIRILDLIGTLNTDGTHSQTSQLNSLKHFTARDNVHLTSDGYIKLAAGAAREAAAMIKADDVMARIPGNGRPIPYWRGFVIHLGIGQIDGHLGLGGGAKSAATHRTGEAQAGEPVPVEEGQAATIPTRRTVVKIKPIIRNS
jgi:hypothetical protein